jgi:hypothetical protein
MTTTAKTSHLPFFRTLSSRFLLSVVKGRPWLSFLMLEMTDGNERLVLLVFVSSHPAKN